MKSICFIGARGGSKGVPQKNIRLINGKPLIAHTIISALDSGLYDHVVVSTEDKKIAQIAKKYGAEIPFLRPKNLSTDTAGFTDVMIHGINELKKLNYTLFFLKELKMLNIFVTNFISFKDGNTPSTERYMFILF